MTVISTRFSKQRAPCGHVADGEHLESRDDRGLVTDEMLFACGCKTTREEYHDGSVEHTVVRHDGRLARNEDIANHWT
ncbi:MAG: hypothetical protein ACRDWI_02860 [Jiangellaceae bacterium]